MRAETGRYGASIDCLEGLIDFADTAIAFSNLGRRSSTLRIPTPVAAGAPPATTTVAAGSAGRYTITPQPAAPFAVVPATAVAPAPVPAPAPAAPKSALNSTKLAVKSRKVSVSVGCQSTTDGLRRHGPAALRGQGQGRQVEQARVPDEGGQVHGQRRRAQDDQARR